MDNYQDHISANGRPDLGLYCVDTVPIKGLHPNVLLDPLKEQFNLPALLVIGGILFGSSRFYAGKYDDILIIFFINYVYPSQGLRIISSGFGCDQANTLVAKNEQAKRRSATSAPYSGISCRNREEKSTVWTGLKNIPTHHTGLKSQLPEAALWHQWMPVFSDWRP